jgi:hypothetical protein
MTPLRAVVYTQFVLFTLFAAVPVVQKVYSGRGRSIKDNFLHASLAYAILRVAAKFALVLRVGHLRAQPPKKHVQAMRRGEHPRAQPPEKRLQAMRRVGHLRAQPPKKQVQGMRRGEHLRAQPPKKPLQGMRRGEHL